MSQDYILEMCFPAVRSLKAVLNFNNNPTAAQFKAAYKVLKVHIESTFSSEANCLAIDNTNNLTMSSIGGGYLLVEIVLEQHLLKEGKVPMRSASLHILLSNNF